ncbi:MAG TPA: hypothetical protein VKU40_17890 [Thermoanaerobaculia bacterium]|nr:hypothetical protein [Thermoanaerobaculia bacterium]
MRRHTRPLAALFLSLALVSSTGCATLEQILALSQVDFSLAGADQGTLAGIDLTRLRSARDLTPGQLLSLVAAVQSDRLPFAFTLHVAADNPAENGVAARLVQLDWTMLLEGRETVSGRFDRDVLMPAGQRTDVPIRIELDLMRFYEDNARDLADLAISLAGGSGGAPKQVELRARPTVQTEIGPIAYPGEISIVSARVGR